MMSVGGSPRGRGPPSPEEQKWMKAEEEKRKAAEKLRLAQAEERRIQREVFRKCGHKFKDVTKKRHAALEGVELPSWVKHLIAKKDRRWTGPREVWRTSKYEKCGACGLVKVSRLEVNN